jgi:hypothetical protein
MLVLNLASGEDRGKAAASDALAEYAERRRALALPALAA